MAALREESKSFEQERLSLARENNKLLERMNEKLQKILQNTTSF